MPHLSIASPTCQHTLNSTCPQLNSDLSPDLISASVSPLVIVTASPIISPARNVEITCDHTFLLTPIPGKSNPLVSPFDSSKRVLNQTTSHPLQTSATVFSLLKWCHNRISWIYFAPYFASNSFFCAARIFFFFFLSEVLIIWLFLRLFSEFWLPIVLGKRRDFFLWSVSVCPIWPSSVFSVTLHIHLPLVPELQRHWPFGSLNISFRLLPWGLCTCNCLCLLIGMTCVYMGTHTHTSWFVCSTPPPNLSLNSPSLVDLQPQLNHDRFSPFLYISVRILISG